MSGKLLKILPLCANTILWGLLLFTAYGGVVSPAVTVIPAIAAMTFPIFLVLTVIVTILCIFLNPLLAVLNVVVLFFCGGPILSYCPMNIDKIFSTPPADARSFTLMTYNVLNLTDFTVLEKSLDLQDKPDPHTGTTMRNILSCAPDIAALQECDQDAWNAAEQHYPELIDSVKAFYPYIFITPGKPLTLLSRYPFEPIDIPLPTEPRTEAQAYRMDIEGHTTYLLNVHLQSIGLSADDKQLYIDLTNGEARSKEELEEVRHDLISKLGLAYKMRAIQADSIREALTLLPGNTIVCGDFNDIPDSYSVRTICGNDLRSAFRTAGCGPGISFHANRFYFRIDHCLYRGDMTPVKSIIPHNPTSDHFPLITTFVWDDDDKNHSLTQSCINSSPLWQSPLVWLPQPHAQS